MTPKMRAALPDLRFEVHHILADGDIVACRSTMTGTHEGRFEMGPFKDIPPTGTHIEVRYMHFFRMRGRLATCGTRPP